MALLDANTLANSTKEVWSIHWLKEAMTFLEESLNTTPIPAQFELSKRVVSKLPLKHVSGGGDQWTGRYPLNRIPCFLFVDLLEFMNQRQSLLTNLMN